MTDRATRLFRRLKKTPLRDLLRGRISGRLDWKGRLAAAGVPREAADFITRVVEQTRLFRLGKAAAADELLAQFQNGLSAGSSAVELVETFGDGRLTARLIRGRVTGRPDWKARLAVAGLPAEAADLITRLVERTWLSRREKAAVADELIAHFSDGLAAGSGAAELVERFGDERLAARLIGRAKRRGRSLPWRISSAGIRATALLLGIYSVLLLRFCLTRPAPHVDYIATVNEPIIETAPNDRAWPIWRQAILASSDGTKDGQLTFPEEIAPTGRGVSWHQAVKWLNEHASAAEMARQAAGKPALGFVLGPGGSSNDPALFSIGICRQDAGEPLACVLLPHLNPLRNVARLLSLDARHAAEKGDGTLVEADLSSLLGLAQQLRDSNGFLWSQLIALEASDLALDRLRLILFKHPALFHDDQLIRLAHAISGPEVAADLINMNNDRDVFADTVQRLYTDDGHGDGHLTLNGLRNLSKLIAPMAFKDRFDRIDLTFKAASAVPMLTASRAELLAEYDRLMDQEAADLHLPIRQIDVHKVESQLDELKKSPVERVRYAGLLAMLPLFIDPEASINPQASCESYLGKRDGTVVGIALEFYRRRYGKYPAALRDLTPELLPAIPADRITGDAVKYRLVDGKPVVYSVGADRIDDAGRPPAEPELVRSSVPGSRLG